MSDVFSPHGPKFLRSRNWLLSFGYRRLLKPLFFRVDPERVHDRLTAVGHWLGAHAATRAATRIAFDLKHPVLEQTLAGIHFSNPVGLSAGFDKEGLLTQIMPAVGYGFMEVGSVTGQPCPGNAKPRLWRLPKSRSLVVYYGLKSQGSAAVAMRLRTLRFGFPVGISIAKANLTVTDSIEAGIEDYVRAARDLAGVGDYLTINISCPNTSGGEPFADPRNLERLLLALAPFVKQKPTFIKLPADIKTEEIDAIIAVADRFPITGFVCTNLTRDRRNPKILDSDVPPRGGLSGKIVEEQSNRILRHVRQRVGQRYILIGSGGVFTAEDAYRKIRLGASLIQMITGMIFRGPSVVSEINLNLVGLLKRDGFRSVTEAVGADVH